ncbi:MAG: glycosyltransferase family 2 protein [Sphingobacteriaceae bacterium]
MKISIVTVVYNGAATIERCVQSVFSQHYTDVEYIIIDGNSTDATLEIIEKYRDRINCIQSATDNGIYDAMNKGIALATGDVVGILNADDVFASADVLSWVAGAFADGSQQIVYGDLQYVNPLGKIVRHWKSAPFYPALFKWGWMPAHPTFYAKRALFLKYGNYELEFGTAADYELMLRFLYKYRINAFYLHQVMVKMTTGGASNGRFSARLAASRSDYKAMKKHGLPFPWLSIILKPGRKIFQFFSK